MSAALVVALALVAPVTSVVAQPAPMSEAGKKKIAKSYVDAGLAAQDAGDYPTALEMYGKAYALIPHPIMLFNQGQAHRLAGHRDQAIAVYRQFLATSPKGSEAATAAKWLSTLESEAATETAAADAARVQAAQAAQAKDDARRAEAARQAAERAAAASPLVVDDPRTAPTEPTRIAVTRDRGKPLRLAGLVAGGVGVASLGVGLVFGLKARSISDDLSQHNAPYDPSMVDDGEAANRNLIIAVAAGGVLVAGGATLYFLGRARGHESTTVSLAPRGGGAMVVVGGVLPWPGR